MPNIEQVKVEAINTVANPIDEESKVIAFKVPESLSAEFKAILKAHGIRASSVLIDFVKAYVGTYNKKLEQEKTQQPKNEEVETPNLVNEVTLTGPMGSEVCVLTVDKVIDTEANSAKPVESAEVPEASSETEEQSEPVAPTVVEPIAQKAEAPTESPVIPLEKARFPSFTDWSNLVKVPQVNKPVIAANS